MIPPVTEYLDLDDLLEIAREAVGPGVVVGDYGLLESALARPRASVFGQDAYSDVQSEGRGIDAVAGTESRADGWKQASCLDGLPDVPGHQR